MEATQLAASPPALHRSHVPTAHLLHCGASGAVGKMGGQKTRLAKCAHARPQLLALQEWGTSLARGHLVAVRVDLAERHLEGSFFLALVIGTAFPAPARMALRTDVYEEGWLIVPTARQVVQDGKA